MAVLIDPALRFNDRIATTVTKAETRSNLIFKCFSSEICTPFWSRTEPLYVQLWNMRPTCCRRWALATWRSWNRCKAISRKEFQDSHSYHTVSDCKYSARIALEPRKLSLTDLVFVYKVVSCLVHCDIVYFCEFKSLTSNHKIRDKPYRLQHQPARFEANRRSRNWTTSLQVLTLLHLNTRSAVLICRVFTPFQWHRTVLC